MPTTTLEPARLLDQLYAPIAAELADVERRLKAELRSDHPFVDELVRYGCLLGGKRLRPALLLLAAKAAGGRVSHEHLTLATVVEMIHTATLVHDDVLDEAEVRRHLATVNARWDNEASVLLGDFLFTHAFYLASTLDSVLGCRLSGSVFLAAGLFGAGCGQFKHLAGTRRQLRFPYPFFVIGRDVFFFQAA
jgi:octaprenyl-diphosphate synthase